METEEIFKDVPGYEGYYQVSNLGRVKSLNRIVFRINTPVTLVEKILKIRVDSMGYSGVILYKDKTKKCRKTHQLVAMAFIGDLPNGRTVVINHIDGDKLNNTLSNLEIVTQRENCSTCFRKGSELYSSHLVGVYWSKEKHKWAAQITTFGRRRSLGRFVDEMDASRAYQTALSEFLNQ